MAQSSVLVMFQPHFDVPLDFPQRRVTTTWNLTVLYDKKAEYCYWEFHPCVAIAKATLNEYYYRTNDCCDLITGL